MKNQRLTTMKKPELLAPAGGMPQLIAAVENGADAVYLGGPSFNARMQAGNFDENTFAEAVRYAHVRGVKIYVTMNTLLTDDDLPAAWEAAKQMYAAGADGFIIQDLGLGRMLREHLPGAKLHLSTQGTVYNLEGVRTAAALGYERVVLSRELTLPEIREICEAGLAEIEVFVHGALCMCYSGQCQLSRAIGGRSANKGACAQPCRLPYTDETGRTAHFLSPKDMCQIDHLGELAEAGVRSFKIEGRMKSPEYVATVVRVYRKYLDLYLAEGDYTVSLEDRESLLQVFNREGFSDAYYGQQPEDVLPAESGLQEPCFTAKEVKRMMAFRTPKNTGLYAGRVIRQKGVLADVQTERPVRQGDVIEIRPADGLGKAVTATVTYLEELQKCRLRIGDIKDRVLPDDKVFVIRDAALMKGAEENSLPNTRKVPVDMHLIAAVGEKAKLILTTAAEQGVVSVTGESGETLEQAQNKAPDPARIEAQLRKTGGTPFAAEAIELDLTEDVFLPVAVVNALRREALEELEQRLGGAVTERQAACEPVREEQLSDEWQQDTAAQAGRVSLMAGADRGKDALPEDIRPFSVVTRGQEDRMLAGIAAASEGLDGCSEEEPPILLNNLGWISRLAEAGIKVYAGAGLNVTNEQARRALEELGAVVAEHSPEDLPKELLRDLMITEYPIAAQRLTDRKGVTYAVEKDPLSRRHYIRRR